MGDKLVQEATEIVAEAFRRGHAAGSADKLAAEEAAYDRGYDEGWEARDRVARVVKDDVAFATRVRGVLREVGLLGNISPCP